MLGEKKLLLDALTFFLKVMKNGITEPGNLPTTWKATTWFFLFTVKLSL